MRSKKERGFQYMIAPQKSGNTNLGPYNRHYGPAPMGRLLLCLLESRTQRLSCKVEELRSKAI